MTTVCDFPGPIFSLAGFCRVDFVKVLARHGAVAHVEPIISFKQRIDRNRSIYLQLAPGRHASLSLRDSQNEYEVALQIVGRRFYEHELALASAFVGPPHETMEKYSNPPIEWVSTTPTDGELEHWRTQVGTDYPYGR